MSYVLGTTEKRVRWYKFIFDSNLHSGEFELLEMLDLSKIPMFGNKETAKLAAKALGLKTWRYVRINI